MSKLGDSDFSVPGIQASDLNDGDLINGTQRIDGEYVYTLPDGTVFKSGPIPVDGNPRDIMMGWMNALRQAIVGHAAHAARGPMGNPDSEVTDARAESANSAGAGTRKPSPERVDRAVPGTSAILDDPDTAIRQSLAAAEAELAYWEKEAIRVAQMKNGAESAVLKWKRVKAALAKEET